MSEDETKAIIEQAIRTPETFTPRLSLSELAVLWQTRAVYVALKRKGVIS